MSSPERDIEAVLDESGPDYDSFSYERPTAGHQGEVFMVTLRVGGETYDVVIKFQAGDPDFALEPFLHNYVADRTTCRCRGFSSSSRHPHSISSRTS